MLECLAEPSKFRQIKVTDRVSDVDYNGEVRLTLHTIRWCQEPNGGSHRRIRIWADPFECHQTQCSDRISGPCSRHLCLAVYVAQNKISLKNRPEAVPLMTS